MNILYIYIYIIILLFTFINSNKINLNENNNNNNNDDDDPSDLILDGIFKCANTIKKKCNLGSKPKLNETLLCLKDKFPVLQNNCMKVFNGLLKDVIKGCGLDLLTQCQSEVATLSPSEGVSCLFKHYSVVSSTCRVQLDLLASYALPCANEAAKYCSTESNPQDIFACLSTKPSDSLDPVCNKAILGYQNCLPMNAEMTNDDNDQVPFDDDDDDDERNHHIDDNGNYNDDDDDDDDDDTVDDTFDDTVDDDNIYSIVEGNDDESNGIPWFGSGGDDTYDDDDNNINSGDDNVKDDFYTDDNSNDDGDDYDDDDDDYIDDNMDDNSNDDDYLDDYSNEDDDYSRPKPKQKPKPKAKPKPNPNGGSGGGGGKNGKQKPNILHNKKLQTIPQKPIKNNVNHERILQPPPQGQGQGGGSKPKPKPGPGPGPKPGPGPTGQSGGQGNPPLGMGKPCWVVDDTKLNELNGNNNDIDMKENFNNNDFKYGGVIAFITFIVSISIIGTLIYLWFKNGRSFRNLTVSRASEIISEKDPYESGYAPTAADDHCDEDVHDRILQLPESTDGGGSIEMSTMNPITNNGYSKLGKNDEVSV